MIIETYEAQPDITITHPQRFDEEGFFIGAADWSQADAQQLAEDMGIGRLTDRHWRIIEYIRDGYLSYGSLPLMRLVCRATNVNRCDVIQLFGSCRNLWRVAGLPNPGEEFKSYMF